MLAATRTGLRAEVEYFIDPARIHPKVGDVFLCATSGVVGAGIRFATQSPWNHTGVVVDVDPVMVNQETPRKGDVVSPITSVGITRGALLSILATPAQFDAGLQFVGLSVATHYGFPSLLADGVNQLTRMQLAMGIGDRMVCSTCVTRYLERLGFIPGKDPEAMTPGDIAAAFGVNRWPKEAQ